TLRINPSVKPMQSVLLDKHFLRKHGPGAYYGQR
ncbi:MAG TPA: L-ribulose-5-phosphate 4-epimerase, partial [Verrucomicrobiae bacterium]